MKRTPETEEKKEEKKEPVYEDISEGQKKVQEWLMSPKGIGILVFVASLIFAIAVILLNTVGEKAVLYMTLVVLGLFFVARDVVGGQKLK